MKQKVFWKNQIQLSDLVKFSERIKIDIDQEAKQEIYKKAVEKNRSKRELSKKLNYGYRNIDNWIKGNQKCIGLDILLQMCQFANIPINNLDRKVIGIKTGKAGNFLRLTFPINIFEPRFIELLIHIFGDGTLSLGKDKSAHYYNTDLNLIHKVRNVSTELFHPEPKYAIWKVYSKGDKIPCPNNKWVFAKKAEWGFTLPGIIPYIISLHCSSLEEFREIGTPKLILQMPEKCIPSLLSALIEDEGCVRPDRLVICTTKYLSVATALRVRLHKANIKTKIHRQNNAFDAVITDLNSLKTIYAYIKKYRNKKRKKLISFIKISEKKRAGYFETDSKLLNFFKTSKDIKFTATEIGWKVKMRKWVVNRALNRLVKNNLLKKEKNRKQRNSFLYSLN